MNRDRDRILEQALTHQLRKVDAPVTATCLDAETFAAWEDGGLNAAAMEAAEVHLSTCPRCQALAGTMAKTVPVAVPVKSHEPFRLWKWWLAPMAAATAAVTIWMVVPAEREAAVAPPTAPSRDAAVAQVEPKSTVVPEPPAFAPVQPPARAEKQKDQLADRLQQRADAPAAEPDDRRKRQEANLEAKKEDADASKLMRENAVAAAETMAAAGGAPAAAAPPPAPATAPAPAPAAPAIAALQKNARFASAPVEVVSPDPLSRWRSVATGVERSEDGGRTWIPVRPPGGESITAGSSPSRNTVWLAGRAGLVLVTVDGFTFARVDLPERADVASMTATDARSATVTTTDGRTFRTDDSGRTWRRN